MPLTGEAKRAYNIAYNRRTGGALSLTAKAEKSKALAKARAERRNQAKKVQRHGSNCRARPRIL